MELEKNKTEKNISQERKIRNIFGGVFFVILFGRIILFFLDKQLGKAEGTIQNNTPKQYTNSGEYMSSGENNISEEIKLQEDTEHLSSQQIQTENSERKTNNTEDILILEDIIVDNNTAILSPIKENNFEKVEQNSTNPEKIKEESEDIEKIVQEKDQEKKDTTTSNNTKEEIPTIELTKKTEKELNNIEKKEQQELQKEKILQLEKNYKENKQKEDFKRLINELVKNYDFEKANNYLKNTPITKNGNISPSIIIYSKFNTLDFYNSSELYNFSQELKTLMENSIISTDENKFYQGVIALEKQDYATANTERENITTEKFKNITDKIQTIEKQMETKKGIPAYYQDTLVAVEFLKSGYFSIAKYLAIKTLEKNEKYSLPYQVLAYADFLTNNLQSSIGYFQQLTKIDPAKHNSYKYMMGISYYWLQDYSNAILHLSQLKNINEFRINVLRYLILAYEKIDDEERIIENYQELLKEKELKETDFVEFFDHFLVQPYQTKGEITLNESEKKFTQEVIARCKTEDTINKDNCNLGEIGLLIATNTRTKETKNLLEELINKYQLSFLYQALGDYYYRKNDLENAKKWYLKASLATQEQTEIQQIKEKLLRLEQENLP